MTVCTHLCLLRDQLLISWGDLWSSLFKSIFLVTSNLINSVRNVCSCTGYSVCIYIVSACTSGHNCWLYISTTELNMRCLGGNYCTACNCWLCEWLHVRCSTKHQRRVGASPSCHCCDVCLKKKKKHFQICVLNQRTKIYFLLRMVTFIYIQ